MKRIFCLLICIILGVNCCVVSVSASIDEGNDAISDVDENDLESVNSPEINAKSAILMDAITGTVIYTKNACEPLPPASVTKIMTLLLVAEAIDREIISLEEKIMVSAHAASMGGSQIFVKEGEEFTVEELLKSTVISSANDAAVALAEAVAGSESAFVGRMNARANELGMKNTNFENATGLDDTVTDHVTSAYDIAIMSRELLKYNTVTDYSAIWQDSIRNGEFILTNTNRLVRYYDGCTGLKTGSTDKAGFCISATAERDGMHLIAVVMGANSRDERNNAARAMLDYGFSNFSVYSENEQILEFADVRRGLKDYVDIYTAPFSKLIDKAAKNRVEKEYIIPDFLIAPLCEGDVVGSVVYKLDGEIIGEGNLFIKENINEIKTKDIFFRVLKLIFTG